MTAGELRERRHEISVVNRGLRMAQDVTVSVTVKPLGPFVRCADTLPYDRNVLREGIACGA